MNLSNKIIQLSLSEDRLTTVFTGEAGHILADVGVVLGDVAYQVLLGIKVLPALPADDLGASMHVVVVSRHCPDGHKASVTVRTVVVAQLALMTVVLVAAQGLLGGASDTTYITATED